MTLSVQNRIAIGAIPETEPAAAIVWQKSAEPVAFPDALAAMQAQADAIAAGTAHECIWLLEHPPLYTAGTSADPKHLLNPGALPIYDAGRGGGYTYHGPGQRIAYVMLDVRQRFASDVGRFVDGLERWLKAALSEFGVLAAPGSGARGVWVDTESLDGRAQRKKIASIGIRMRRGVSMHGLAINVSPDLEGFSGIVACGGDGELQTSLAELGVCAQLEAVDHALHATITTLFRR